MNLDATERDRAAGNGAAAETTTEEIAPAQTRLRRKPRGERPLLEVSGLRTSFATRDGLVRAVDGISFSVDRGEIMGLVGESGCGKSVTSLSILRLVPPPGRIEAGSVTFEGRDLLKLRSEQMRSIRGQQLAMIFQQPTSSLNPVWDVGRQIGETLEIHKGLRRKDARVRALELLRLVGIPDPERRLRSYPHELSGGMAQRVMIAMALACEPDLLIADEPTTALDVTIQAQILELLKEIQEKLKMALIFISHNLGVVARLCDRIGVMYAGSIVELADKKTLFTSPQHPYTIGLLEAIPRPELRHEDLKAIPGTVCNLFDPPSGCKFHPRCSRAQEICEREPPPLEEKFDRTLAACHFPG